MRRSKLEMYMDILKALAHCGPLKLTHVMYEVSVNCGILKEYLNFLVEQNLVEEKVGGKGGALFSITQRGIIVLNNFRELEQVLPIIEEERKSVPTLF